MPTNQGVITAMDIAKRDGFKTHHAWIMAKSRSLYQRNQLPALCTGEVAGDSVEAFLDWGRWSAPCPNCGGTEYVDPGERIFFCFSCANGDNDRHIRPVEFEPNRVAFEVEIMKRPVNPPQGLGPIEAAMMSRPPIVVPGEGRLHRSWPLDHDKGKMTLKQIRELHRMVGID